MFNLLSAYYSKHNQDSCDILYPNKFISAKIFVDYNPLDQIYELLSSVGLCV